jgi:hypothetical protein
MEVILSTPRTDLAHGKIRYNTINVAGETLSWKSNFSGAGVSIYDNCLVLTKEGYNLSQ